MRKKRDENEEELDIKQQKEKTTNYY